MGAGISSLGVFLLLPGTPGAPSCCWALIHCILSETCTLHPRMGLQTTSLIYRVSFCSLDGSLRSSVTYSSSSSQLNNEVSISHFPYLICGILRGSLGSWFHPGSTSYGQSLQGHREHRAVHGAGVGQGPSAETCAGQTHRGSPESLSLQW